MMEFQTKIKLDEKTIQSPNLAELFAEDELKALGVNIFEGYQRDEESRMKWKKRTQAAMDLAMQISKDKNFPWAGCANVAFPLVTIATMQFHSRAYPTILNGPEIVKYRPHGDDPQGIEMQRCRRIGAHMSYQLLEEDQSWEEQHDRLLINIPIVGCAFKKTYHSGLKGHNVSDLVMAQDMVMDYYAKSVEDCARKTHIIPMYRNEIHEKIMTGVYCDVREENWYKSFAVTLTDRDTVYKDNRNGLNPPMTDDSTPYTMLEQHMWMDLDKDGYKEPYIVTIEYQSRAVLRIVSRVDDMKQIVKNYKGEIVRIMPTEYFTKYGFIPSPDGGVYDIGFGVLLGPLNESVNSILNQLIDAGTMSNSGGGFLGRGAKIRGGQYTFAPLEWKRVDSTGDDLRKNIFPLPVREPSNVLLQLLSLLINYTQRISGSTDTLAGENPGQNTPAQTTQTMVEEGLRIYNAIYKRVWRSMKEEYKKLYRLNSIFLPTVTVFGDAEMKVLREDYQGDPNRISPVADPNVTSDRQRMQQAMALKQAAMSTPGYNLVEVEQNYLKALHIDAWQVYYPGPEKMPPPKNPKVQVEEMKLQMSQMKLQADMQKFTADLMEQRRLNSAKILQLEAQAAKLIADAGGVETGHQIAAFEAAIGALKVHDESLRSRAELMMKSMEQPNETTSRAGMERVEGTPVHQSSAQNPASMAV